MRLFRVLPTLGLLLGTRASSLDSRSPAPHSLDTRALIDVCVTLNTELAVPDLLGIVLAVGLIGESTVTYQHAKKWFLCS